MSYYDIGAEALIGADDPWMDIGEDDDGGYDVGADDVEDLLAVSGARRRNRRRVPAAALALARNKALLTTRGPTKARYYPLGVPATTVAAGAAATIALRPQVPYRAQRLVVPSDIAGSFVITDIRVGKNSQFVTSDPVPARAFQEDASSGIEFGFDTAQVSMDLSIAISNVSLAQQVFRACFLGAAVE